MTTEEKLYLTEIHEMIHRHFEMYPYEAGDFQENGYLTDEAALRILSAIVKMLPEKARQVLSKHAFEERMNAYCDELVATGAMERGPDKNGMPSYSKIRDWTEEESERAWARADARIERAAGERGWEYKEARKRRRVQ